LSRDRDFEGRVAIVTGGSGGIGAACVEHLQKRGASVAVFDRNAEGSSTPTCFFRKVDISVEADVIQAVAQVTAYFGKPVDTLICMAAIFQYGEVHTTTAEEWDRVLGVNLKGTAFAVKAVIPAMREMKRGAIVMCSSITGTMAFPGFVPYSATKAAIIQMTRDIALDNGPYGIRVNCVAPGAIFTVATVAHANQQGIPVEEMVSSLSKDVSLRRIGQVDEIAKVALFLASDEASYVHGATLMADGGMQRK